MYVTSPECCPSRPCDASWRRLFQDPCLLCHGQSWLLPGAITLNEYQEDVIIGKIQDILGFLYL